MNATNILGFALVLNMAALIVFALSYLRLWGKIRFLESESAASREVAARIENLGSELEACGRRLEEAERRPVPIAEDFAVSSSVHLNRRGQVALLRRRGETPRRIASTLGISQGEVKLMMKLHDLNRQSEAPTHNRLNLNLKSCQILDNALGVSEGGA